MIILIWRHVISLFLKLYDSSLLGLRSVNKGFIAVCINIWSSFTNKMKRLKGEGLTQIIQLWHFQWSFDVDQITPEVVWRFTTLTVTLQFTVVVFFYQICMQLVFIILAKITFLHSSFGTFWQFSTGTCLATCLGMFWHSTLTDKSL